MLYMLELTKRTIAIRSQINYEIMTLTIECQYKKRRKEKLESMGCRNLPTWAECEQCLLLSDFLMWLEVQDWAWPSLPGGKVSNRTPDLSSQRHIW